MRFFIKYIFTTVLVSVATAIYLLCCTTQGLLFSLHSITSFLPGTLKIEKVSGTLFSGFSLQTISYQTREEKITLQSLTLHWHPLSLLHKKLAIDLLVLEQPHLIFLANDTTPTHFNLDDLKFLRFLSINKLIIHQLALKQSALQFDLTGEMEDHWDFHWQLHVPTLNTLCSRCSGSLTGSGNISGERLIPTINAEINGRRLVIGEHTLQQLNGTAHIVVQPKTNSFIHLVATDLNLSHNHFKKMALTLSGNIAYEQHNLLAQAQIAFSEKPVISIDAVLPHFAGFTDPKQKITAAIKLNLEELDGLRYFIPEIQHPRGTLLGDLNITGTVLQPAITGIVDLKQGQVAIPALGVHLNDIAIQAILDKSNLIVLQGNLRSATGTAQLQGTINLNKENFPVELTLQGKNLNAADLPEYKVFISPDIKLNFIYPHLTLDGKIIIDKAIIKVKNFMSTLTLPSETVFVDQPQTNTPDIFLGAKLNLDIDLSNDIYFSYKDFETHLGGHLRLNQAPSSPITATGEIHAIQGKYSIYGQDLIIKTGRLIFAGNVLTNPSLNIEAIRTVKDVSADSTVMPSLENDMDSEITVGVRILGMVSNPQISLFSIPGGLTQTQILSALGGEGAALMGALSFLNPNASNSSGITNKLTKILKATDINISSVQTFNSATNQMQSTPSVVVGRQLSKKLSLHYSIGIFNPISVLNMRYQFNKHWAIQSETSTLDNGADILYSFE